MADKNNHHPQWPPHNLSPQEYQQQLYMQQMQQWQWQMNHGVMPAAWQAPYIMMQQHVQQSFPNPSAASQHQSQPKPSSSSTKDEVPKVIKPKEVSNVTQTHSAGIQSPKPNNPGFLLGAQRDRGSHAFSPYASRTGTPQTLQAGYNESTDKTTPDETGIDLSVNKSLESDRSDKTDQKPVGIAHARQRTNIDLLQKEGCKISSSEQSTTSQTTAVTTISTSTTTSVTNTMSAPSHTAWQHGNMPPFMTPPYHHFTLNQQPSIPYMGLLQQRTGLYPGFPPNTPNNLPPYYVTQPLQNVMPELTVKTSQSNPLNNASTSPTKPKSNTNSPKSPLDKFREKCGQKRPDKQGDKSSPVQTASTLSDAVNSTAAEKPSTHRKQKTQKSTEAKVTEEKQKTSEKSEQVSVIQQKPKSKDKPSDPAPHTEKPVEKPRAEPIKRSANQTKRDPKPAVIDKPAAKQRTPSPVNEQIPDPTPDKPTRHNTTRQHNTIRQNAGRQNNKPTGNEIKPRRGRKRASSPPTTNQAEVEDLIEKQSEEKDSEPEVQPPLKPAVKRRRTVSSSSGCDISPPLRTTVRRGIKKQVKKSESVDEAETKEYLWKEDELEPIICKYDSNVYDICMDDDVSKLESALTTRLKLVNIKIETHQAGMLLVDTGIIHDSTSEESPDKKTVTKNKESKFNVRSDSHPSMKIKAAAAAKRRKSDKSASSVKPLLLDVSRLHCRSLTQPELRTTCNLILICIEGLLYECRIKPIEPPDIYGIVIDGERNSKPRIFTEEDLLNHTYTNVTPREISDVKVGTRLCCYWSDMIGCLYPGTVTEIIQDKTGSKNVKHLLDIEYDDGDSGRFPLSQTRLLPADYPHVKYDTSSVLAVGRRRRSAAVPDTPPIMISPPANRGRVSNYNQHSPSQTSVSRKTAVVSPTLKLPLGVNSSSSSTSTESTSSTSDEDLPPPVKKSTGVSTILWRWNGDSIRKESRGRGYKEYYNSIIRNGNIIEVGDCAVFKSNANSKLPFIGKILSMWQNWSGKMMVNVKWFYHPQEIKVKLNLPKHKGALFESEHSDDNEIQTIIYKCWTLDYEQFISNKNHLLPSKPNTQQTTFYLAGKYDAARSKIQCLYV